MQPKPTLIFDFGGVLIDWNPRHLYRKLFPGDEPGMERFLSEVDFMGWNLKMDGGQPFAQSVSELSALFPHYADQIRAYDQRWEESMNGTFQPVVAALHTLKSNGYALHGLSNWSKEKFSLVRHQYPFLNQFESIMISGEVRLTKPDPRIYLLLLQKIQRRAEECLFIDDSRLNITTAQQLGFNTIHFQSPQQFLDEMRNIGIAL